VLFCVLIGASFSHASSSCQSANFDPPTLGWARIHLTDRPFDRSRGCFVGDEIAAVVETWPGTTEMSTGARAGPTSGLALAK